MYAHFDLELGDEMFDKKIHYIHLLEQNPVKLKLEAQMELLYTIYQRIATLALLTDRGEKISCLYFEESQHS